MNYDALMAEADQNGIDIIECEFKSPRIKGLYCDGTVAINRNVTNIEKSCILAEELGHYHTTVGNILDQNTVANRKQELHARAWAYQKGLQLCDIVNVFKYGCRNRYEIADYLNVTEAFLQEGIEYFKGKYGPYVKYGSYIVYLEPLGIMHLFSGENVGNDELYL